jgi:protein ImuB
VDRLGCLELQAFPLQLLARDRAEWRGAPAAFVERDAPQGLVLWVNAAARAQGVSTGMRYAAALGLCSTLRADTLTHDEIARGVAEVTEALQHFSPHVEPCAGEPGVYWISGRGTQRLFGAARAWGEKIRASIEALGFESRLAIGTRKFTTYALVKDLGKTPLCVLENVMRELRATSSVGLASLFLDPKARDALAKLGITTVGEFARLPAGGILQRFGADVHRVHRMAAGALDEALAPVDENIPFAAHVDLDAPEVSIDGVLVHLEELLRPLATELEKNGEAARCVGVRLELDDRAVVEESVAPAQPTSDAAWLLRLVRMRLEKRALSSGALRIEVILERVPVRAKQPTLFADARRRTPAAAARALGALRALFGELAVVRAVPASAHLPERSFTWERCDALVEPKPRDVVEPPLVRKLYERSVQLPPRARHEPDGWLLRGVTHGSVVKLSGPYRLSGGWWRSEVEREYYYAELTGGEIAWVYYDVRRRRWFLQGSVS